MMPNPKMIQQLQAKLAKMQEELGNETIESTVNGVTVVMTGQQKFVSIKLNPEAVDPEDLSLLEDLLVAALNQAVDKSRDLANQRLGSITGGIKIPGMM